MENSQLLIAFSILFAVAIVVAIFSVVQRTNRDDDVRTIELVLELEDTFQITVPDADYEKIRAADDAIRYFEDRKRRL